MSRGDQFHDFRIQEVFVFLSEPINVSQFIKERHIQQAPLLSHQVVTGVSRVSLCKTVVYCIEQHTIRSLNRAGGTHTKRHSSSIISLSAIKNSADLKHLSKQWIASQKINFLLFPDKSKERQCGNKEKGEGVKDDKEERLTKTKRGGEEKTWENWGTKQKRRRKWRSTMTESLRK